MAWWLRIGARLMSSVTSASADFAASASWSPMCHSASDIVSDRGAGGRII